MTGSERFVDGQVEVSLVIVYEYGGGMGRPKRKGATEMGQEAYVEGEE